MQQLGFNGGICAHRQRQLPLWSGQPARSLDQLAPQGAQLFKMPQRCTAFRRVARSGQTPHLHFPVEVVGQQRGEYINLIACELLRRHVVHLRLRFQPGEHGLL